MDARRPSADNRNSAADRDQREGTGVDDGIQNQPAPPGREEHEAAAAAAAAEPNVLPEPESEEMIDLREAKWPYARARELQIDRIPLEQAQMVEARVEEAQMVEARVEEAQMDAPRAEEAEMDAPGAEEAEMDAPGAEEAQMDAPGAEEAQMDAPGAEEAQMDAPGAEEAEMVVVRVGEPERFANFMAEHELVQVGAEGAQIVGARAVPDEAMFGGLYGRVGVFHLNPADFPPLGLPHDNLARMDDGDDSDNDGNDLEEEAMDDALDNLDDDDEDDGIDEDEVENGVAFVHVFSPRQQIDSDHGSESEDENDGERVEHFDVNLPGQHLYIPNNEDPSEDLPPDPAPLEPPEGAPPPRQFVEEPEAPPQQEEPQPQPAGGDLDALRIFDDLPQLGAPLPSTSTHCPPLPTETIRLPVLEHTRQHNTLMVLPGMKVPLMITTPRDRAVMAAARRTPQRAFVSLSLREAEPVYGCTLQVVQAREGLGSLHIIARATQRFRLKAVQREVTGVAVAEVELLPEVLVTAPLAAIRHVSHDRHLDPTCRQLLLLRHRSPSGPRGSLASPFDALYPDAEQFRCNCGIDTQDRERHRDRHRNSLMRKRRLCHRYTSVLTQMPPWVLQELDVYRLAAAVRKYLLVLGSEGVRIPESPVSLCEYACLNMPLPDPHRRQLLQLSCCHQKLLYLLNLQEKWHSLVCTQCHAVVTKREDLIIVSSEGQQSAYVNPRGFVHEILTVRCTDRLYLTGGATAQHSWFPGYSWTIASCRGCGQHVGWKFTANTASLRPKKFYGLTRGGVMPM